MRHSKSTQNFYQSGKKVNPNTNYNKDSPQKDSNFKSTYAADFNNPSDQKNSRYKHRQSETPGKGMMSLKASGTHSKSRF